MASRLPRTPTPTVMPSSAISRSALKSRSGLSGSPTLGVVAATGNSSTAVQQTTCSVDVSPAAGTYDVLVTVGAPDVLTAAIPKTVEEVEAACASGGAA